MTQHEIILVSYIKWDILRGLPLINTKIGSKNTNGVDTELICSWLYKRLTVAVNTSPLAPKAAMFLSDMQSLYTGERKHVIPIAQVKV